jgi:alanyl-tRNA synthetase
VTQRLYYDDAYGLEFSATVVEVTSNDQGRPGVVLDKTLFYPTSGGQMHDTGTLGDLPVVDVLDEATRIVHVVEGDAPEPGVTLIGQIDGERRAHHRQQHTGQHVLSRVIEDHWGWPTISSRLGETMNTLEIEAKEVTSAMMREMEDRTNRILWEGRGVRVRYLEEDEAAEAGLRKKVEREGPVRVVEVEGIDRCACGGTHVASTAEIGLVAIVGLEKIRGGTRLLFLCGDRATRWRRERVDWLDETARQLTTGMDQVPETVLRLQDESRARKKRMEAMAKELVHARVPRWREGAEPVGSSQAVLRILDADEALAASEGIHAVVEDGGLFAAFVVEDGKKCQVLVAASDGVPVDCGKLLSGALAPLGGRGGGQASFARGGCQDVLAPEVIAAIRAALASDADD